MSEKVISLARRRTQRLGLTWSGMWGKPVNRAAYDAWIERDGSVVLRFDPSVVEATKGGSFVNTQTGETFFRMRAGVEFRIPADATKEWFADMQDFGIAARQIADYRRGVHEWRCTPRGDGTYIVEHASRKVVFVPFKPRLRKGFVPTGEMADDGFGHKFERRKEAMVAPNCTACGRVVQVGETAYQEQKKPHSWREFRDALLCSDCIKKKPAKGPREVAAEDKSDG